MFEAKLSEALVLKKIIDAIRDLVTDVNIDATPQGNLTTNSHAHSVSDDVDRSVTASNG